MRIYEQQYQPGDLITLTCPKIRLSEYPRLPAGITFVQKGDVGIIIAGDKNNGRAPEYYNVYKVLIKGKTGFIWDGYFKKL